MNKNFTITDIEEMNESDIRATFAPDFEAIPCKGYTLYLVYIPEYFKYSMLVCADGKHIRWADDYEIHHDHQKKTREELRELYIKRANLILFTDDELAQPLKSYQDFERRRKYIMEYLPLRRDFMSMFQLTRNEEERAEVEEKRKAYPIVCPPALGYFAEGCEEFAKHIEDLYFQLIQQEDNTADNYDYNFSAFYYELGNHEYHINTYQGDWDTLSAFGNIEWKGQGEEARQDYYKQLQFTKTQIKAFEDARKKFLKDAAKNGWY